MEGMRYMILLVVLATTVSADLSFLDTKECTSCNECLKGNEYNVPVKDVCSYCRCNEDPTKPTLVKCPPAQEYDPTVDGCVPSTRCGDPRCDLQCNGKDHGTKYNSTNPCGYCECTPDGGMEYHDCPEGTGYANHECVPTKECTPNDLCDLDLWKPCYIDMEIKLPSYDPCGYCEVTSTGMVHKSCPPGTGWDHYECVPKDECCDPDPCSQFECPLCYHGMRIKFANPDNNCGFCCCEPVNDTTIIEKPFPIDCPEGTVFDADLGSCVYQENAVCNKRDRCSTTTTTTHTLPVITTPETCPPPPINCQVTCPPEHYGKNWLMENPIDPCSFCCCQSDGTGKEIPHHTTCVHRDEYFDPAEKICRRNSTICPRPPYQYPPNCRRPGDNDGCWLVEKLCAIDADGHLPNPYYEASFCQCEFDKVHMMPCPPGTFRFIDSLGTCI